MVVCIRGCGPEPWIGSSGCKSVVQMQDMESVLGHFTVGKRIALYMARVLPQHTIDHLAYETAQLLHEEDPDTASPSKGADCALKVCLFSCFFIFDTPGMATKRDYACCTKMTPSTM